LSSSIVTASAEVLYPNVAHDLSILQQCWKGNEDIKHKIYTDEEERVMAINFLNNHATASENSFTKVVSKTKKKNL
jgi:hypothetical protein